VLKVSSSNRGKRALIVRSLAACAWVAAVATSRAGNSTAAAGTKAHRDKVHRSWDKYLSDES
jgi:hypothetical protein